MLTGRYLFDTAESVPHLLAMILADDLTPVRERRPDVPAGLAGALHTALAKEPDRRHPDATAFRAALFPFA